VGEQRTRRRDNDLSTPPEDAKPDKPTQLGRRSWWGVLKRTVKEFQQDNLTDWAAALTYYSVLSIFPGLLVLLSLFSMFGDVDAAKKQVQAEAGGGFAKIAEPLLNNLQTAPKTAGVLAIAGLLGAVWSASGYVGAFMRASNAIYDVPEGRPIWKTIPIRLGVTIATGLLLAITAAAVVFTGAVAERTGNAIGLESQFVTVWDIVKWPVLVAIVSFMFALLYWASPNARQGGFRWVTPGGVVAVALWIIASAGFALYISMFANYSKTYGALGGVIIFLVWLWISNIAILLGAEFDAELERGRAIEAGHPADKEPFVELRDDRKVKKGQDTDLR